MEMPYNTSRIELNERWDANEHDFIEDFLIVLVQSVISFKWSVRVECEEHLKGINEMLWFYEFLIAFRIHKFKIMQLLLNGTTIDLWIMWRNYNKECAEERCKRRE